MDNTLDESLIRDTICGVELQLIELVESQARAKVQGRDADADALQLKIDSLHDDLAKAAEIIARSGSVDAHGA